MAADQNPLVRPLPAGDFAEDVGRRDVGQCDGAPVEMNDDFPAAFLHALRHPGGAKTWKCC